MNTRHYLQPQVGKYKRLGQKCRKLEEAPQGDLHNQHKDMSPSDNIGMYCVCYTENTGNILECVPQRQPHMHVWKQGIHITWQYTCSINHSVFLDHD